MQILSHIHLFVFILYISFRTIPVQTYTHEFVFMWTEWVRVRIKTVLINAQMGRGVAYRDSIDVYEHGMCVLLESIDTCEY